MKKYDYIIIGAGAATSVAFTAAKKGLNTALIDESHPGGTCLNRGCIPTKTMLQCADVAEYVRKSSEFGINSEIKSIDLNKIMEKTFAINGFWRDRLYKNLKIKKNIEFYQGRAKFIDEKIIEVNGEKLYGEKIILAVGMRPIVPNIKGLKDVDYWTSRDVFEIKQLPKKLGIIGGGYIGMEFAHFFSSLGVEVHIVEMKDKVLSEVEPDVSDFFNDYIKNKEFLNIHTSSSLQECKNKNNNIEITILKNNELVNIEVDNLLVAIGRTSNADLLDLNKTNVEINEKNFIKTDDFFLTSNKDIWAFGDCIGSPAFRHISGYESKIIKNNLFSSNEKIKPNYSVVPYAVFTSPEIAAAGLTYKQAKEKYPNVIKKKLNYFGCAKGKAIGVNGFSMAIIDKDTEKILGFHIVGPYASILIHEILPIMTGGLSYKVIDETIHIHPALSEVVGWTFE